MHGETVRYGMSAEWNNPESHTLFRNINNQEKESQGAH
jgi:hypothetical protein